MKIDLNYAKGLSSACFCAIIFIAYHKLHEITFHLMVLVLGLKDI